MGVRADLQAARDVTGDISFDQAAHFALQRTRWRLFDVAGVALVVVVAIVYPPAVLAVLVAAGVVNWTWRRELIVAVGPIKVTLPVSTAASPTTQAPSATIRSS